MGEGVSIANHYWTEERGSSTIKAVAAIAATFSIFFAARSFWQVVALSHDLPIHDQWMFVSDYFSYLDGSTSLWTRLFDWHNEHKLLTTRLVLLIDARLFDMNGTMPVIAMFVVMAFTTLILSRLASDSKVGVLLTIGIGWSLVQIANFTSGFLIQHPFVLLFALCTLTCFSRALTEERWWPWLAAALTFDFLTVYSLGSGLFLIAPIVALAVWLRRVGLCLGLLAAFHAILMIAYLHGNRLGNKQYSLLPDFERIGRFLVHDLFLDWWSYEAALGLSLFVILILTALSAIVRKMDRRDCVLLSFACFIAVEALAVAYSRGDSSLSPVYNTHAAVFVLTMLCLFWRLATQYRSEIGKLSVLCALIATTFATNANRHWDYIRTDYPNMVSSARDMVIAGDKTYGRFPLVFTIEHFYPLVDKMVTRMRLMKLGPFAKN